MRLLLENKKQNDTIDTKKKRIQSNIIVPILSCSRILHCDNNMTTQGLNTANAIIAGFSKLNFKKTDNKSTGAPQRRRKLSQMLPTLDESLTSSMFNSETFSVEFDPASKPKAHNSLEQSQNTLATVECSESSEFFSYHSDGEEEDTIILREIPPASPVPAGFDCSNIQTPKCSNLFELVYPDSPLAKRRKRATLPRDIQLDAIENIPRPPLTV